MSNHTPTPWFVGAQNDALYIIDRKPRPSTDDIAPNQDVCVVAKTYNQGRATGREDANAAFIVRACNAHNDLVAALKNLVAMADYFMTDAPQRIAIEEAVAAIAQAEGKT
jgi:hypothetical protein